MKRITATLNDDLSNLEEFNSKISLSARVILDFLIAECDNGISDIRKWHSRALEAGIDFDWDLDSSIHSFVAYER